MVTARHIYILLQMPARLKQKFGRPVPEVESL